MFINKLEEYFKSLNMPTRFKDLNIDVDVNQLVDKLFIGGIGQISHQDKPLDKDVARLIYQMAI